MDVLSNIWRLSDVSMDNLLSLDEFCVAFHLIVLVSRRGMALPAQLPAELVAVAKGASADSPNNNAAQKLADTLSGALGIDLGEVTDAGEAAKREAVEKAKLEAEERSAAEDAARQRIEREKAEREAEEAERQRIARDQKAAAEKAAAEKAAAEKAAAEKASAENELADTDILGVTSNLSENFTKSDVNSNQNVGETNDFMGIFGGNAQSSGGVGLGDSENVNMAPTVSESIATGTRSTSSSITESFADFDFGGDSTKKAGIAGVKQAKSQVREEQAALDRQTASLSAANDAYASKLAERDGLLEQVAELKAKRLALEEEQAGIALQSNELRTQIDELTSQRDKEIKMLAKKARAIGEASGRASAESESQKARVSDLKKEIKRIKKEAKKIVAQAGEIEEITAAHTKSTSENNIQLAELQHKLKDAREQLKNAHDLYRRTVSELAEARVKHEHSTQMKIAAADELRTVVASAEAGSPLSDQADEFSNTSHPSPASMMSEPLVKEPASDGGVAAAARAASEASALTDSETTGTNSADAMSFQPEMSSSSSSSEGEEDDDEVDGNDGGDFPVFDEMKDDDEVQGEANGFGDFPGEDQGNGDSDSEVGYGDGFGEDGAKSLEFGIDDRYDDQFGDPDEGMDDTFGVPDEGDGFGDFPDF
eukprot:g4717.t1